jgi:hypothetical protein
MLLRKDHIAMKLSEKEAQRLRACIAILEDAVGTLTLAAKQAKELPVNILPARGIETLISAAEAIFTAQRLVEHQLGQLRKIRDEKGKN